MDLSKLKLNFPASDIEWRLQSCVEKNGKIWGIALAYVTNRAIMNRLDEVCGPENWKNVFEKAPDGGILCGISIKCGDEWVTKWDGAENTDIEAVKGGLSGAMKRAAVQWGIGRYLYNLSESFINADDNGIYRGKLKNGTTFKWNPPKLPDWAVSNERSNVRPTECNTPSDKKKAVKTQSKSEPATSQLKWSDDQKETMKLWKDGTFTDGELENIKKEVSECKTQKEADDLFDKYSKEYKGRQQSFDVF